ncbi:hypothetical protein WJX74_009907 [Apatococcus lobatus]|uniref:Protein TIC 20 n=1 Tax=Apatococcus lobatus TaxID=904363 RepID=A0AAW1QDS2_9CHLO
MAKRLLSGVKAIFNTAEKLQQVRTCPASTSTSSGAARRHGSDRSDRVDLAVNETAASTADLGDLVVVIGTTLADQRPELVAATRFWRKGLAAFIATNAVLTEEAVRVGAINNEIWTTYPDSNDGRTQYPGDTRAALVPLLAHRALRGQYKWQLYGDDDTIWFVNGALELAQKLDSDMPYMVTDAGYWHHWGKAGFHAKFEEDGPLHCLPCTFASTAWHKVEGAAFTPPRACPCTTQLLCDHDERDIMPEDCKMPEWFRMVHHIDGGAGALLSHGLLEALNGSVFEACVTSGGGVAGDYLLTYCMWQAGFAPTYPSFNRMPRDSNRRHTLFNPGGLLDGHHKPDRTSIVADLLAAVEQRPHDCGTSCTNRLKSMVSLHLKSQRVPNMPSGVLLLRSISSLYDAFLAAVGKKNLTDWPLVQSHLFQKPLATWNASDIPAMTPARRRRSPRQQKTRFVTQARRGGSSDGIDYADRAIASLPYLVPLFDGLKYGKFVFMQYPIFMRFLAPLDPLVRLYFGFPFASLIVFFAIYSGIVQNQSFSRYVRYNGMQSILLDILLILPSLLERVFPTPMGGPGLQIFIQIYNTIFLFVFICVSYGIGSCLLGKTPRLPLISDAANQQVR